MTAILPLASVTELGLERVMGMHSTSVSQPITYIEKGKGTIQNTTTTVLIPTQLKTLDFASFLATGANAQVALGTTVKSPLVDATYNPVFPSTICVQGPCVVSGTTTSVVIIDTAVTGTLVAANDAYNGLYIDFQFIDGTVARRKITDYVTATKAVTLDSALPQLPIVSTVYTIYAAAITVTDPGGTTGSILYKLEGRL